MPTASRSAAPDGPTGPRVVSLVPSVTETLLAWGLAPVGCSRFCPPVPGARRVGGTKNPDLAAIGALAPDLVVLDEEENRREDAEALAAAGLALVTTAVRSVADLDRDLARVAGALGLPAPAPIAERLGELPQPSGRPRRVLVPIWRRPWMLLGPATYAGDLLRRLGVEVCAPPGPDRYPALPLAEWGALRADLVLAPSEPYPFGERHRAELASVAPVRFVDGQDLFWWGARTPAAFGRLAAVLGAEGPGGDRLGGSAAG